MRKLKTILFIIPLLVLLFLFTGEVYPQRELMRDASDSVIPVIVVIDGAKILESPGNHHKILGKAKFLSSYYLVDREKINGNMYYLAVEINSNGQIKNEIGWFLEYDVIVRKSAMKDYSGVVEKALFVNKWNLLQKEDSGFSSKGINILVGPGDNYGVNRTMNWFDFQYVYEDKVFSSKGDEYILVGDRSVLTNYNKPRFSISGWVKADYVQRWNTQYALQYNKSNIHLRKEGVKVFRYKEDVEDYLQGIEVGHLSEEDISNADPWKYDLQRYPLLCSLPNDIDPEAGDFLKLGFICDIFTTPSRDPLEKAYSQPYGTFATNKFIGDMMRLGVASDLLARDEFVVYGEGWATLNDPITHENQLELVLFVNKHNLYCLNTLISGMIMCDVDSNTVEHRWSEVFKINVLDAEIDVENDSVGEIIRKITGIEIGYFMDKKLNYISRLDKDAMDELLLYLKYYQAKLEKGFLLEKEIQLTWDEENNEFIVTEIDDRPIWHKKGNLEYGWIPYSEMPEMP